MSAAYLPAWRMLAAAGIVGVPLSACAAASDSLWPLVPMMSTAMVRAAVQLAVLGGLVLAPLMESTSPTLVLLYVAAMVAVAAREAASKLSRAYDDVMWDCLVAAVCGAGLTAATGITVVLQPTPWFSAQTVIPVCGMVLGNALNSIGLAMRTFLAGIADTPGPIQLAIGLGASRFEAVQPSVVHAVVTAMTPTVNTMTVAGLVSIPGMLTGQVLAGQDPLQASRYQTMILYLINAGALSSLCVALVLAARRLLDDAGRLRLDRLGRRAGSGASGGPTAPLSKVAVKQRAAPRRVVVRQVARGGASSSSSAAPGASPGGRVALSTSRLEVTAGDQLLFTCDGLEVLEGEICAVSGPSGSGKSTLLGALAVTLPPTMVAGTKGLRLGGARAFDDVGGSAWRAACLTVPQLVPPVTGTTCAAWFATVLRFGAWKHLDPTAASRRLAAVAVDLMLTPEDVDGKDMSELSGGERHRAVLACALALAPPVLLLDEPTAALDAIAASAVESVLTRYVAEASAGVRPAVVIVSHDAALVSRLAHKTATLE